MMSEQQLANEYPEIFELWDKEPDEIDGPAPSITTYGFQCAEGWHSLIESLCETLDRLEVDIKVTTIKEKFGGLRFYHSGISADDDRRIYQASGAIKQAEQMSFHVCEECGAAAELRQSGWFRTLCYEHWSEEKARRRELSQRDVGDE